MSGSNSADGGAEAQDRPVLFQQFFKSGSRTYAAQVKQAGNGKPFLVLTEGKRDPKTNDVKKSKLFVCSDDLTAFFHLLQQTASFLRPLRQQMKDGLPLAEPAAPPISPKPALQPPAIAMKGPMPRTTPVPIKGTSNVGTGKALATPAITMKPPMPRPTPSPSIGIGKTISPRAQSAAVVRAMPARPVSTRPIARPVAAGRPSAASCESAKNVGRRR